MKPSEWIKKNMKEKGREWVANNYYKMRVEANSKMNRESFRRRIGEAERELLLDEDPDYQLPSQGAEALNLTDNKLHFQIPDDIMELSELTANSWSNTQNPGGQFKTKWTKKKQVLPTREEVAESFLDLIKDYEPPTFKVAKINPLANKRVIISLPDMHIGKYVWGKHTKGEDYTPQRAAALYLGAIRFFLSHIPQHSVKEIILEFGEDYFNVDNLNSTTTKGTPQLNTDPREMVDIGLRVAITAIDACRQIAPTSIYVVPGNHDKYLTYVVGLTLKAHYRNTSDIYVDAGPEKTKVISRDNWAVMIEHLDQKKPQQMVLGFAIKYPQEWAKATYRETHCGHLHHNEQMLFLEDQVMGAKVIFLSSLAAEDEYHNERGYFTLQEAQMRWYDENGYCGSISYRPGMEAP